MRFLPRQRAEDESPEPEPERPRLTPAECARTVQHNRLTAYASVGRTPPYQTVLCDCRKPPPPPPPEPEPTVPALQRVWASIAHGMVRALFLLGRFCRDQYKWIMLAVTVAGVIAAFLALK